MLPHYNKHQVDWTVIHNFEQPDSIPKNIAKSEGPPKQEVIDAHIT